MFNKFTINLNKHLQISKSTVKPNKPSSSSLDLGSESDSSSSTDMEDLYESEHEYNMEEIIQEMDNDLKHKLVIQEMTGISKFVAVM